MEKLREWFGTPAAAGNTLIWLCWVTFLVSVVFTLVYLAVLVVLALTS